MKISMDGLRHHMINAYSRVVDSLNEAALSRSDAAEVSEKMEELRQMIAGLCCVFSDDTEDFSNMSEDTKRLKRYDPLNQYGDEDGE